MNIRKADIFFTASEGTPIGELIQFFTHGRWTHVAIIDEWPWIWSADPGGFNRREILREELYSYDVLTCPTLTDDQREKIIQWAREHEGIGYDFAGLISYPVNIDLQDKDRLFCSESALLAYKSVGVELQERIRQVWAHPDIIYISPLLDKIV